MGFDLNNFAASVRTVFTPGAGQGVNAVQALADGELVIASQGGLVALLQPDASGQYTLARALTALTGIPSDPSALEVLENAAGGLEEALVTNTGLDEVFVFMTSPTIALPPPAEPGGPVTQATAPPGELLQLVPVLSEAPLEAASPKLVPVPGDALLEKAPLPVAFGGGNDEGGPEVDVVARKDEGLGTDVDERLRQRDDDRLRQLDLFEKIPDPDTYDPWTRGGSPALPDPGEAVASGAWPPDRAVSALLQTTAVSTVADLPQTLPSDTPDTAGWHDELPALAANLAVLVLPEHGPETVALVPSGSGHAANDAAFLLPVHDGERERILSAALLVGGLACWSQGPLIPGERTATGSKGPPRTRN
jgi:hypothetical protein